MLQARALSGAAGASTLRASTAQPTRVIETRSASSEARVEEDAVEEDAVAAAAAAAAATDWLLSPLAWLMASACKRTRREASWPLWLVLLAVLVVAALLLGFAL